MVLSSCESTDLPKMPHPFASLKCVAVAVAHQVGGLKLDDAIVVAAECMAKVGVLESDSSQENP